MADNNANADADAEAKPEETAAIEENKPKQAAEETKTNVIQMKRISGLLSLVSFVISLPILASVIWLLYMKSYDCEWLFKLPRLQIGVSIGLICVFLICNAALFLRSRLPMVGIIVVLVPLTVMFTVGLAFLGANNLENRRMPASPLWFKMKIHDDGLWGDIKECIYDTRICQDLATTTNQLKSYDFSMKKLSSIESGCCTPPKECHMQYVNATFWEKNDEAVNGSDSHNSDCDSWKNDRDVLCYDCQSCRLGYSRTLQSKWMKLGVFLVCMAVILFTCHLSLFLVTMWELHVTP
ncbi:hypothetical protein PTKIN_Ptkin03bG0142400 [Pterospermum kingtungense]